MLYFHTLMFARWRFFVSANNIRCYLHLRKCQYHQPFVNRAPVHRVVQNNFSVITFLLKITYHLVLTSCASVNAFTVSGFVCLSN